MKESRRVQTANGPGMVLFRPDGRYAFVPSSFTLELDVVDTKTYRVIARVPQTSPFSPNLAVSQDGTEVWFPIKAGGYEAIYVNMPAFGLGKVGETVPAVGRHERAQDRLRLQQEPGATPTATVTIQEASPDTD